MRAITSDDRSGTATKPPADAKSTADTLTGDAASTASDNPVCKLFTYTGEPLNEGGNAAMGSGCQWTAKDDSGDVLIQPFSAKRSNAAAASE